MNKKLIRGLDTWSYSSALLSFAFQSCYTTFFNNSNTADVLIVGRFLGQDSLAAVGVGQLPFLI